MNIVENIEKPDRRCRLTIYRRPDGHYHFIESKLRQYGDAASFYRLKPFASGIFGTEADVRAVAMNRLRELNEPARLLAGEKRLQLVGMVLLRDWDPIGVCEEPFAQDEYDHYVEVILDLLLAGTSVIEMVEHLSEIQYEQMGLPKPEHASQGLARVSEKLVSLATSGALANPP